jgi:hypothetical protein
MGQVFLDLSARRLYYLNETARQLRADGLPFTPEDLAQRTLHNPEGQLVQRNELPLIVSLREERPVEMMFLWLREHGPAYRVCWTAAPLMDGAGRLLGILGCVCCSPPEPDWQALAGLAHDLRTPLKALEQAADSLKKPDLPDGAARARLEDLQSAADRALGVARELLHWSRAPAQRGRRPEPTWFPLGPFLDHLVREHSYAAQQKGLTLLADLKAAEGWAVHTDRVRLGRLLSNLIANAITFTGSGGITFTASFRNEPTGRLLVLGVVDTAVGLSSEEQESIFHTFQPSFAGVEEDSADSGLGLVVVDRLAKELEMEVEVHSEYGSGGAFRLILPWRLLRPTAGSRPNRLHATEGEPEKHAS